MKKLFVVFSVCLAMFAGGCAFIPQEANLSPRVNIVKSSVGDGHALSVNVVDDRPDQSLGRRGTGYGPAAEIKTNQDLANLIKLEVIKGLEAKGFNVLQQEDVNQKHLSIELRELKYSTSQGIFTGGVHVKGALKGTAKKGSMEYSQMYRYDNDSRVVVVPTAKANEEWLNRTLSNTIEALLLDDKLMSFLTSSP